MYRVLALVACAVLGLLVVMPAWAADYYISLGGSDSNPGTEASPWRNPWIVVSKTFMPSDTIYIKAGTYIIVPQLWSAHNHPTIHLRQSGTAGNPITMRNFPGDTVVLSGTAGGPTIIGVSEGNTSNYVTFDGLTVVGGGGSAIAAIRGSNNVTFQNSILSGGRLSVCDNTSGFRIEGASTVTIKNNKISDVQNPCGDGNASAMTLYAVSGVTIENNEMFNMPAGIHLKTGTGNIATFTIRNNYIHDTTLYAFGVSFAPGDVISGIKIYQNIFATAGSGNKMDSGGDAGFTNDFEI